MNSIFARVRSAWPIQADEDAGDDESVGEDVIEDTTADIDEDLNSHGPLLLNNLADGDVQVEETYPMAETMTTDSQSADFSNLSSSTGNNSLVELANRSWEEMVMTFFVKGKYDNRSKRKNVICKKCNAVFPASKSSKTFLTKHILVSKDVRHNTPVCAGLSEADRLAIQQFWEKTQQRTKSNSVTTFQDSACENSAMKGILRWIPPNMSSQAMETFNLTLVRWFCTSAIPFNAIDNQFAEQLFVQLRPGFQAPSRRTLGNKYLDVEYGIVRNRILQRLEREQMINIGVDGWTDINHKSIYAVVVMFPSDGKEFLYSIEDASAVHHTGTFVSNLLAEAVDAIGPHKICGIISDDASNMRKGRNDFVKREGGKYEHIFPLRCIMHAFGLILKSLVSHSSAKEVISQAQEIVTYFRASHIPSDYIRHAETYFGEIRSKSTGLKTSNSTRMTSIQICCASVIMNMNALKRIASDVPECIAKQSVLHSIENPSFWIQLNELNDLMIPVCQCIMAVQSNRSRVSDVTRYWIYLTNQLQLFLDKPSQMTNAQDYKESIVQAFNSRLNEIPSVACSVALFLDPRFRCAVVQGEDDDSLKCLDRLHLEVLKIVSRNGITSSAQIDNVIDLLHAYTADEFPFSSFSYGGKDFDPREWWERKCGPTDTVSELAKVARLLFSLPVSAAGPERTFSLFDWIQAKRRSRLGTDKLAKIATIKQFHTESTNQSMGSVLGKRQRLADADEESSENDDGSVASLDGAERISEHATEDSTADEVPNEVGLANFQQRPQRRGSSYTGPALKSIPWFDYNHQIFRRIGDEGLHLALTPARTSPTALTTIAVDPSAFMTKLQSKRIARSAANER